jgi:hypothetical protein
MSNEIKNEKANTLFMWISFSVADSGAFSFAHSVSMHTIY